MIFKNQVIHGSTHDFLRITEDNTEIINCNIVDTWTFLKPQFWLRAHIDSAQGVPQGDYPNAQYSLAILENLTYKFNSVVSQAHLQGLFMSDGLIKGVKASHNVFMTKSQHDIALAGCLDGEFWDNWTYKDGERKPASIDLYPARIAGGENIRVLSFCNKYRYEKVNGENINDMRTKEKRGTNLIDFDVIGFESAVAEIPHHVSTKERVKSVKAIALNCGDRA